ncbi:MAG TPA: DUF4331 family protein [Gemmatimonadales bacterium]|jgi:hypothetical protein|nr:DUF4331 family protein [Gemmatimonadales bacterium]
MNTRISTPAGFLPALLLAAGLAACNDNGVTGPGEARMYDQVQRLGNPLVSEVFLAKRSHPQHGTTGPADDVAGIGDEFKLFVTVVAGRSQTLANTLASVLLPDMLIVQTDKPVASAGWLTWLPQLGNGWGGRKLPDDVVDLGLLAIFGDPFGIDPAGAAGKQALTTDNVASDSPFLATFPYLAAPN